MPSHSWRDDYGIETQTSVATWPDLAARGYLASLLIGVHRRLAGIVIADGELILIGPCVGDCPFGWREAL